MIKVSQSRLLAKQAAAPALTSTLTISHERTEPYPHLSAEYTNDFAQLVHPSPNVFTGMSFGNQALASDITHGLLSLEGDWPEWIQNSVSYSMS
jgi:hypothetical protein